MEQKTTCPKCGNQNRPGASFCNSCGHRLEPGKIEEQREQQAPRRLNPLWLLLAIPVLLALVAVPVAWYLTHRAGPVTNVEGVAPSGPLPTDIAAPPEQGAGRGSDPQAPTPTPVPTSAITAAPEAVKIAIEIPPAMDELLERYPELKEYIKNLDPSIMEDEELDKLHEDLLTLYEKEGSKGLYEYLTQSGLIDTLNFDPVYFGLATAYHDGGIEGLRETARARNLLTDKDELLAVLTLDTKDPRSVEVQLNQIGITVRSHYANEITVAIPLSLIKPDASTKEVLALLGKIAALEHVIGVRAPVRSVPLAIQVKSSGEGVEAIGAPAWQTAGITGKGVKVGILDQGFGGFISALSFGSWKIRPGIDQAELDRLTGPHGTACARIIQDIAPEATLYIAPFDDDVGFRNAVEWLQKEKVDIISNSNGWLVGPMDGENGFFAPLINETVGTGALWVNSAGNQALTHMLMSGGFNEGKEANGFHEFPHGEKRLQILPSEGSKSLWIVLNWQDNWNGAKQNYDLYLYDKTGRMIDTGGQGVKSQNGKAGDNPYEEIFYHITDPSSSPFYIAIRNVNRASDKGWLNLHLSEKSGLFGSGGNPAKGNPNGSVTTPGDAHQALTVGAIPWQGWQPGTDKGPEEYSSQGPLLDGADSIKPDISAPTDVSSSLYPDRSFGGTSAAAPHVAGAAALIKSVCPDWPPVQVKDYLLHNAADVTSDGAGPGADNQTGFGRLLLPTEPLTAAECGESSGPTQPPEQPVTPPPVTPLGGNAPAAQFTAMRTAHNVTKDGQAGMTIYASFDINNMQGQGTTAIVYFADADKPGDTYLRDNDGKNRSNSGRVIALRWFIPSGKANSITDMDIFMPYAQLDLPPDSYHLKYQAVLWNDADTSNPLAVSEWQFFNYGNDDPTATFNEVKTTMDVNRGGKLGIETEATFTVERFVGNEGTAAAYFYMGGSENTPLHDTNGQYKDPTGQVAVGQKFTTRGENDTIKTTLFMPYEELHMSPGQYHLKFNVVVWDSQTRDLGRSDWYPFDYRQE